jgi:hypothetical protein
MKSDAASTIATALTVALFCGGCGGTSDDGLYSSAGGAPVNASGAGGQASGGGGGNVAAGGDIMATGSCSDVEGRWAIFVEVGVDWQSATIKAGAGTTKQWILVDRTIQGGRFHEQARVCGVGAQGVPLGSPWFSIVDIPELNIVDEWTGVTFKADVFDSGRVPQVELWTTVTLQDSAGLQVGDRFETESKPFLMGAEGLAADAAWPDVATLTPLMADHDGDGSPGISGIPFTGHVPGEDPGIDFADPRLGIVEPIARANQLFMAVRTQAALDGKLVSCDPPRVEGTVVADSLQIDSRVTACTQSGTSDPCTPDQVSFLDSNLPVFEFNGTSVVVGYKVPENTTCADVRGMKFEKTQ